MLQLVAKAVFVLQLVLALLLGLAAKITSGQDQLLMRVNLYDRTGYSGQYSMYTLYTGFCMPYNRKMTIRSALVLYNGNIVSTFCLPGMQCVNVRFFNDQYCEQQVIYEGAPNQTTRPMDDIRFTPSNVAPRSFKIEPFSKPVDASNLPRPVDPLLPVPPVPSRRGPLILLFLDQGTDPEYIVMGNPAVYIEGTETLLLPNPQCIEIDPFPITRFRILTQLWNYEFTHCRDSFDCGTVTFFSDSGCATPLYSSKPALMNYTEWIGLVYTNLDQPITARSLIFEQYRIDLVDGVEKHTKIVS
jgi:hypothetical protein